VDWSILPELIAVSLLACAFYSVARRSSTQVSRLWLIGWLVIVIHFTSLLFVHVAGNWGTLAEIVGFSALTWAGTLFMWSSVPYRKEHSSPWMFAALLGMNTLYMSLLVIGPAASWALTSAAALFGVLPLAVTLLALRGFNHPLRWVTVILYGILSVFLLRFQYWPGIGSEMALYAVLFTVYFDCCIHFSYSYRRATAGAFITITGFLTWAAVFVTAPLMMTLWPAIHVESEVWNLPKFLVAAGMILLVLEEQIEHNRHLALHDDLTGLPNRRLFQDRLDNALARARRTNTKTALLQVDLNRFKLVNDTLGHPVGDLVLQCVAGLFSARVRRSDTVARTGGDEFSVILEEPTSRGNAVLVGKSLQQLLSEPLNLGEGITVRIGASIGIAVFPDDAPNMDALCSAADRRMYDAKHGFRSVGELSDFAANCSLPALQPKSIAGIADVQ
jgi:diguanylate cyclase (GGDEF)-like protein